MRVLFDARPASSPTGIGRYTRLLASLLRQGISGHECYLLGPDRGADLSLAARSSIEEELELPFVLEREAIDVFHSPLFALPASMPVRSVVTLHDAIPLKHPELTQPAFARLFAEAGEALQKADRIVCPSAHARADVLSVLELDPNKVRVVPEAPAQVFKAGDRAEAVSFVRARFGLAEPFVLWVGSLEPRKNPGLLLDALALHKRTDTARVKGAFVGPVAGFDLAQEAGKRGAGDAVHALGYVADDELACLYRAAALFAFTSLYEGFGLPVIEAFACGTPVIATNVSAIPEIAGDAAMLVDPHDPQPLARAMADILRSSTLRDELRARGERRLRAYSTDAVRRGLAELYAELERE